MKKSILLVILIFSILSCEKDDTGLFVGSIEVFNGDAPDSWEDLNLSNVVGENYSYVTLKLTNQATITGDNCLYYFRQNGDTAYYFAGADNNHIIGTRPTSSAQVSIYTDDKGVIEWKTDNSLPTIVEVIAFIK
jgi:hypothetical protein